MIVLRSEKVGTSVVEGAPVMVGDNDGVKDDVGSDDIDGTSDGGFDDVGNNDGVSVVIGISSSGCKTTVELGESDETSSVADGGTGPSSGKG